MIQLRRGGARGWELGPFGEAGDDGSGDDKFLVGQASGRGGSELALGIGSRAGGGDGEWVRTFFDVRWVEDSRGQLTEIGG